MSDLLTPAESHAFQSFLSSIDYSESNDNRNTAQPDWSSYSDANSSALPDVPHAQGREALTKATKDLMSLDAEAWNTSSMMQQYQQNQSYNFMSHQPPQYAYDFPSQSQNHRQSALYQQQSQRNVAFPFLSKQGSQPQAPPHLTHSHSSPPHTLHPHGHGHVPQPISIAPLHTLAGVQQDLRSSSSMRSFSSMSSPPTTSSSVSSFSFASSSTSSVRGNSNSSTLPSPTPSAESIHPSGSPGACQNKRSSESSTFSSNKRIRPSPPAATSHPPNKATLLSPSQKKANHIQSEQKRRANIRRGYEALCDTVPALREAIRLEEEAQMNADSGTGRSSKAKRGRRGKVDDGTGEKIDGRAGPRSENIVLGKTIDYINELLNDRQSLLARLERARSNLAPGAGPAPGSSTPPLWEREWKGGSGREGDAEEEDEDEDEE